MKPIQIKIIGIIAIIAFSFLSCSDLSKNRNNHATENKTLTFADSTWIEFANAMESKNIDFLLQNSLDTIQCAECRIGIKNENEFYETEMIYRNHLNQLMHLESLLDKEYSTFQDDNLIHVNYIIKTKSAETGGYNLIFTFVKTENGFKFRGMIMS